MEQEKIAALYVLIGMSGSGKSTFAKEWAAKTCSQIVSTDEIRSRLFGDESIQTNSAKVFREAYHMTNMHLRQRCNVVFDATNTTKKGRDQLLKSVKVPFYSVAILMPMDLAKATRQNSMRERVVPGDVIQRQYEQLLRDGDSIPGQFEEVVFTE